MSNEEAAFQKALDTNPEDWTTRLVFADWLQEHDDPRAVGMRAIVVYKWSAYKLLSGWSVANYLVSNEFDQSDLPRDWFKALFPVPHRKDVYVERYLGGMSWVAFPTRREVDDLVVLAFSKLPDKRRETLLRGGKRVRRRSSHPEINLPRSSR